MKAIYLLIGSLFLIYSTAWADEQPKDSLKEVSMEEIMVIATPKESLKLRNLPLSSSLLSHESLLTNRVQSIKDLTGVVPNLFLPDYGSKMTSAVYIRGIGSRINTPSIGLYVDNIPFVEKSSFDFNYADVERIDILRGPQSTLYGRNAMGGLIRVHTKSPFSYQGTEIRMAGATHNDYRASFTHYRRPSETYALSVGGFYEYENGFFNNEARQEESICRTKSFGGRIRSIYKPRKALTIDLNLSYEYNDQRGYPYQYTGALNGSPESRPTFIGKIAYNDQSNYYRSLLNVGLNLEYKIGALTLSAITGYQRLDDNMHMDQDFTEREIFRLQQKQKSDHLSQELILKSESDHWLSTTGVMGLYQWLTTEAPMNFEKEGMQTMENGINRIFPDLSDKGMTMGIALPQTMLFDGTFKTPLLNLGIYHQSTFKDLLLKGLSATVGCRLDYEKSNIDYHSGTTLPFVFNFSAQMGPTTINIPQEVTTQSTFIGCLNNDYWQFIPKAALQYDINARNNIYLSVSKGYRSGGYNIQMFSDLLQNNLSNEMKSDLKEALINNPQVPAPAKAMIEQYLTSKEQTESVEDYVRYQPEYTWSYEIGTHLTLFNQKLQADLAAFYMNTRNQQIARFAENGMGRVTVNAGKSRSLGFEANTRLEFNSSLSINASYGYTQASFTDYVTNEKDPRTMVLKEVSYNGKYVPFVPKHTLNAGAQYVLHMAPKQWLSQIRFNANYTGIGGIYWTEKNDVSQPFYNLLSSSVTFTRRDKSLTLWIQNALDRAYTTFYFESMNKGFRQQGKPLQAGIEFRWKF